MTKDEIKQMTPDQLRAEIARRKGYDPVDTCPFRWVQRDGQDLLLDWTNDLNTAWALAEEMNAKSDVNVELRINGSSFRYNVPKYAFIYSWGTMPYRSPDLSELFFDDIAPVAICRGWLMWDESRLVEGEE